MSACDDHPDDCQPCDCGHCVHRHHKWRFRRPCKDCNPVFFSETCTEEEHTQGVDDYSPSDHLREAE